MHGMEHEIARELQRRRLEEAELYRLRASARRSASARHSKERLVSAAGVIVAVAVAALALLL